MTDKHLRQLTWALVLMMGISLFIACTGAVIYFINK